ncbi:MAG: helix-turn-helix domain-containing protein [Deltaproteobacteria bacterium]|nr:helix-turn-helix domain-containing protein [Deltaproteobacteria bacterium]
MEKPLHTARELAAHLKIALSTVRAYTRLTDIPRHPIGRLIRFNLSEVQQWLRDGGSLAPGHRTKTERARARDDAA